MLTDGTGQPARNYKMFKWLKTNRLLQRLADGASIPWPPVESEGFVAKVWIDAGNVPAPEDPPIPPNPRLVLDEQERVACKGDATILSLINQTRAEWLTWAGANFTTLTVAERNRLGTLFWVVAVSVRRLLRNGG